MQAYKLFRVRRDGSLGSLVANKKAVVPVGQRLRAKAYRGMRAKGLAFRPGWHACRVPRAPHLTEKNRRWYVVEIEDYVEHRKPDCQGGVWYVAKYMTVVKPMDWRER